MARMVLFMDEVDDIVNDICVRMKDAEDNRTLECEAVIRIQAWYRGVRVRAYIKYLHQSATNIQRVWRGFRERQCVHTVLLKRVYMMKYRYYCAMAAKIQKIWRGRMSRKKVFDFYGRKKYFREMEWKADMIRRDLDNFACHKHMQDCYDKADAYVADMRNFACKHHYLVSTKAQPGVFNSIHDGPTEVECYLRNAKPRPERKKTRRTSASCETSDPSSSQYDNLRCCVKLPPTPNKQHGPFRDPKEVQAKRYRPLCPSLRSQSNFYAVEEARKQYELEDRVQRITDDEFVLHARIPATRYERSLHSQSQYDCKPTFREEHPECWIAENFRHILPPISPCNRLQDYCTYGVPT